MENFYPQGSREPRPLRPGQLITGRKFLSTRLSRASTNVEFQTMRRHTFLSTRLSRASTFLPSYLSFSHSISIHKALASLDTIAYEDIKTIIQFLSTRLSRASTLLPMKTFRPLFNFYPQGSREPRRPMLSIRKTAKNFYPQGSREPRLNALTVTIHGNDFYPQGSREPRHIYLNQILIILIFLSTRLSRASTMIPSHLRRTKSISIHKALASLDVYPCMS